MAALAGQGEGGVLRIGAGEVWGGGAKADKGEANGQQSWGGARWGEGTGNSGNTGWGGPGVGLTPWLLLSCGACTVVTFTWPARFP